MARDSFEIIYSQQHTDFVKGRSYANPRYFTTPRSGVTKVYLVGHWPAIEKAYKSVGVPVEYLDENMDRVSAPIETVGATEGLPKQKDFSHVEIPEGWRDLPWVGATSIRILATQLTDTPVLNKAQAVAVITAELARRPQEQPQPPAPDANDVGGNSVTTQAAGSAEGSQGAQGAGDQSPPKEDQP